MPTQLNTTPKSRSKNKKTVEHETRTGVAVAASAAARHDADRVVDPRYATPQKSKRGSKHAGSKSSEKKRKGSSTPKRSSKKHKTTEEKKESVSKDEEDGEEYELDLAPPSYHSGFLVNESDDDDYKDDDNDEEEEEEEEEEEAAGDDDDDDDEESSEVAQAELERNEAPQEDVEDDKKPKAVPTKAVLTEAVPTKVESEADESEEEQGAIKTIRQVLDETYVPKEAIRLVDASRAANFLGIHLPRAQAYKDTNVQLIMNGEAYFTCKHPMNQYLMSFLTKTAALAHHELKDADRSVRATFGKVLKNELRVIGENHVEYQVTDSTDRHERFYYDLFRGYVVRHDVEPDENKWMWRIMYYFALIRLGFPGFRMNGYEMDAAYKASKMVIMMAMGQKMMKDCKICWNLTGPKS